MGVNQIPNVSIDVISTPVKVKDELKKATDKAGKNNAGQSNAGLDKSGQKKAEDAAAVYEKSDNTKENKKVYKRDTATIDRLIDEAEKRSQSLRNLVEKMLLKQGETFDDSTDIYALLRGGKVQVDPETRAQAQRDIAEDGYWGVTQTSDRLVSFAKALTGGDPSKADEMIDAVKKGFGEATKTWGGDLPGISRNTMDAAIEKLEDWRDSITED
ncbi:MAG TPA: hypothetical protein VJ888_07145 [Mobilitalea sp.]|nr:hypothetical protein [Mobilitalea sp.]